MYLINKIKIYNLLYIEYKKDIIDYIILVLEILIRISLFYIILKVLTFSEVLVFLARVFRQTVQPLVLVSLATYTYLY
jgi:hypothetical protein